MIGPRSLRGRLLQVGILGILLAALLAAWLLGEAFERAAGRAFDRALGNDFAALAGLIEARADGSIDLRERPADSRYARPLSGDYWQLGEGLAALRSRSLWDADIVLPPSRKDGQREILRVRGPSDQWLRVARQRLQIPRASDSVVVWVAANEAALRAEAAEFRLLAAAAVGLLTALLLGALFLQVQLGLQPLKLLSTALNRVRRGEQARLDCADLPSEIQPLGREFNELLDHHARSIQRARHAASDLAHALKTPLAVLDAASQAPGADAGLAATVRAQSARMQVAVSRQLATATVADFQARTAIAPVARSLAELLGHVHRERALHIDIALPAALEFRGARDDLEDILGNLMDNACKWAQRCVRVSGTEDAARGLCLWVEDDGPGLSDAQAAQALERGVRLDQRVQGSGLGLSIVHDLAAAYGGRLRLGRSEMGGLLAEACFARTTPPT